MCIYIYIYICNLYVLCIIYSMMCIHVHFIICANLHIALKYYAIVKELRNVQYSTLPTYIYNVTWGQILNIRYIDTFPFDD